MRSLGCAPFTLQLRRSILFIEGPANTYRGLRRSHLKVGSDAHSCGKRSVKSPSDSAVSDRGNYIVDPVYQLRIP